MKTLRFISVRMMTAPTPTILNSGRDSHIVTGYYPRTSDGKRKSKGRSAGALRQFIQPPPKA